MLNDFEKPARQTLRYLFSEYKKGPNVIYPINAIAKKYGVDPVALSEYMADQQWIRECWVYSGNVVACRITISGIEEVDPVYVQDKVEQIIGGLADAGSSKALLEILEFKISEFTIASDLVNQLQSLGLVQINNSNNTIRIELTDTGRRFHEKKNNGLLTLMA